MRRLDERPAGPSAESMNTTFAIMVGLVPTIHVFP
jgi:hypothetical protein